MLFSSKKGEIKLILDVQSSIVRGTLVHTMEGIKPRVLFTHSVVIPYKQNAQSGYLVKMALSGLQEILEESGAHARARAKTEEIPRHINTVHYVLSSPWIVSQARVLAFSLKNPTVITYSYVQDLIARERANMASDTKEISVVEEKVFDVRMNGYSISAWEGHRTKELEISFVSSVAGSRMIERFIEVCSRHVRSRNIHFHSSLFLQHLGIQDVIRDHSSYTLVHVHGELTDIALVRNGSCYFFGSYPLGVHTIVRTIAREVRIDELSAESLLSTSVQGQLDPHFGKKEALIIESMSQTWVNDFKELIDTKSAVASFPQHVIISAHSHEKFYIDSFKKQYPQVSLDQLDIADISALVQYDMHAEKLKLTGLYVLAIHTLEKK